MAWTVIVHPAVEEWLETIDNNTLEQIAAAVRELGATRPGLGPPWPTR
jgi:hypothetical protein